MKRILATLTLLFCVMVGFAQTSGGMISRNSSRVGVTKKTSTATTQTQKKSATSARNVRSQRQNSSKTRNSRKKATQEEELPDLTAEDFYQWGEEEYNAGNYGEAKEWYEMAAMDDHAEALYSLGFLYYNGLGVTQDRFEAAQWYLKAANKGHVGAAYILGMMLVNGDGVQQDLKLAFEQFKIAADGGHMESKFFVAFMYDNGEGTAQNEMMARRYYEEAYDYMYKSGREAMAQGDGEQAEFYFGGVLQARRTRSSYDIKEVRAACCLGYIYYNGLGTVEADYNKSYEYFKYAYSQGNREATFYMGVFYMLGHGVVKTKKKTANQFFSTSKYEAKADVDKVILSSAYD